MVGGEVGCLGLEVGGWKAGVIWILLFKTVGCTYFGGFTLSGFKVEVSFAVYSGKTD